MIFNLYVLRVIKKSAFKLIKSSSMTDFFSNQMYDYYQIPLFSLVFVICSPLITNDANTDIPNVAIITIKEISMGI